jgi:alpha-1,2-mannosyltransferase
MTRRTLPRFLLPAALAVLAIVLFNTSISREMADFEVYRRAGERSLASEPLYRVEDGHFAFKYLPAFALAMAPAALLGDSAARFAWFALSWVCLAVLLGSSVRVLPDRRRSERSLILVAFVLMAKFYAHELVLGQANLVLGALLIGGLAAVRFRTPNVAALCIGAAIFIKPYAAILLPWLVATCGAAAGAVALALISGGLLLPAAVYGWSGNLGQLSGWWDIVSSSTAPNLLGADNISLAAMWAKWIGPGATASALAMLSGLVLVSLAAVIWRQRARVAAPEYLEYAFLMLLIPLLSPQGWDYVLLLATPAVVCLADRWRELHAPWRWTSAAAVLVMGLSLFDVMGRERYVQFMMWSIVSVCAIVLAFTLAELRRRALA